MKVSIIIPTYNRAELLKICLNSIKSQTYSNWECIIVDDYSTDNTPELLTKLTKNEKRFRYLKNTRAKGGNGARNAGLFEADGDLVLFLDSDDMLTYKCLEQRIKYINDTEPNDFYVFRGATFMASNPLKLGHYWNIENKLVGDLERFFALDSPWQTTGGIWKRQFLLKNEIIWDENLHIWQDVDFHITALRVTSNYSVNWNEHVDYLVRSDASDSISRTSYNSPLKINSRIYFFQKYTVSKSRDLEIHYIRPILENLIISLISTKKWKELYNIVNIARKNNIISSSELTSIKLYTFLNKLSWTRLIKTCKYTIPFIDLTNYQKTLFSQKCLSLH